jgi:Carboxypeptidase regulatory-like domain
MRISLLKTTELIVSVGVLLIVNPLSSGQLGPAIPILILIHGYVVNSAGQGVSGATVEAIPENLNISLVPSTITDGTGGYTIASQVPGQLRVLAFKESDGYPNTAGLVFTTGDEHFPLIDAMYGQVLNNVDIVLPPPDGVIQGIVRNAKTGSIAAQARITMNWVEKPEVMYSSYLKSDGTFLFALPLRPIAIEITAPGFKAWHYGSGKNDQGFAFLRPGSNTKIDINLEPETSIP